MKLHLKNVNLPCSGKFRCFCISYQDNTWEELQQSQVPSPNPGSEDQERLVQNLWGTQYLRTEFQFLCTRNRQRSRHGIPHSECKFCLCVRTLFQG